MGQVSGPATTKDQPYPRRPLEVNGQMLGQQRQQQTKHDGGRRSPHPDEALFS